MRTKNRDNRKLVTESVAFGLGYAAVLIWAGSAIVASFTDHEAYPYWPNIPHLRTDTSGVLAFAVAIVTLTLSRYLQLGRRGDGPVEPAARSPRVLAVQALADTALILGTGMVAYLSMNAVTHPGTLSLQLTHLWPWPSEGTVRVIGLAIVLVAAAGRRYLRATANRPVQAAAVPEKADVAA